MYDNLDNQHEEEAQLALAQLFSASRKIANRRGSTNQGILARQDRLCTTVSVVSKSSRGKKCCVEGCTSNNTELFNWRHSPCSVHEGFNKGQCACSQPFYLFKLVRQNVLMSSMFAELCLSDSVIEELRYGSRSVLSESPRVCSNHFHKSMARQINAFPILGLNKSRRRIRLITMKYQMDALLPEDFDTMNLDAVRRIPCFKIANPKTVAAECRFDPYQPEEVKKGEELRYLMYSTDDELFGLKTATIRAANRKSRKRPIMLPSDNGSESDEMESSIHLRVMNNVDNGETQYRSKRIRNNKYRKATLDHREVSSAELVTRLEKMGCSVVSVQAPRDVSVKSKLRCYVDDCAVLSREAGLGNPRRNFLTTLPTNVETALQWMCLCLNNVARQNHWILKLIAHIQESRSENPEPFCNRLTTAENIKAFPFRICDRHFRNISNSLEEASSTISESTSEVINPTFYLPNRKVADPNTDNLLLRRRYVMLLNVGLENVKIDLIDPDSQNSAHPALPSICCIPGCGGSSTDMSTYGDREQKMYPVPLNYSHYRSWCLSVQDAIGVRVTTTLPREGFVCEKHFASGELYLNGKLQNPTIFAPFYQTLHSPIEDSANLTDENTLTCLVRSCKKTGKRDGSLRFLKIPDAPNLRDIWLNRLRNADPLFEYPGSGWLCEEHFVSSKADLQYWIPSLKLSPSGISPDYWIQWVKDMQYSTPFSKKRCCIETDAIRTKLARICDKSLLLYNLILCLHECYGLEKPPLHMWDESIDDALMYGRDYVSVDTVSLANALVGLHSALEEHKCEMGEMAAEVETCTDTLMNIASSEKKDEI